MPPLLRKPLDTDVLCFRYIIIALAFYVYPDESGPKSPGAFFTNMFGAQ